MALRPGDDEVAGDIRRHAADALTQRRLGLTSNSAPRGAPAASKRCANTRPK